jgi:hypothetical protein
MRGSPCDPRRISSGVCTYPGPALDLKERVSFRIMGSVFGGPECLDPEQERWTMYFARAVFLLLTAVVPNMAVMLSPQSPLGQFVPMPVLQPSGPRSPKRTCSPERPVTQMGGQLAVHLPRFERRGPATNGPRRSPFGTRECRPPSAPRR